MSERFYVSFPLQLGSAILQGPEAHHLSAVSRFRQGDAVCLFNGDGREYRAEITSVGRRQVEVNVLDAVLVDRELPFRIVVACPLPKGDRGQVLVEKLTELGVTSYIPLQTQRSIVHPGETRLEKLQRYVIEASKQCGRNLLMGIESLQEPKGLLTRKDLPDQRFVADPGGARLQPAAKQDTVLAVGPEGGFAAEEVEAFRVAGWKSVALGSRILRVETAAIAAVSALTIPN